MEFVKLRETQKKEMVWKNKIEGLVKVIEDRDNEILELRDELKRKEGELVKEKEKCEVQVKDNNVIKGKFDQLWKEWIRLKGQIGAVQDKSKS